MTKSLPLRVLTLSLVLLCSGCEEGALDGAQPLDCTTLRALADRAGLYIGGGFVEGSHDPTFRTTLAREFNSTTVPLYWSQSQPTLGTFDFTAADAAVAVAQTSGLRQRGHPLIWGRLALPAYVQNETDPEALRTMMRDQITTLMTRYRGQITQYDVVNEPITLLGAAGDTSGLETYVFYRLLGPGYIREALDIAHAVDPDAKLFINDFFVERPGDKQDRFFDLIKRLVDEGAPLHGVGFQGHFQLPVLGPSFLPTRAELESAIRRFAALGLEVEITEIDVTLDDRSPSELAFQRGVYADTAAACLAVAGCTGITTWGISDQYTWIKDFFRVDGAPLLFDEAFAPKPAYFGVRLALLEHICGGDPCAASCIDRCGDSLGCL